MSDPDQDEWVDEFLTIVKEEINHVQKDRRYDQRLERLKPLFAYDRQLERICNKHEGNSFVESAFAQYTYECYNDHLHYKVDDSMFIINHCGLFFKKLNASGCRNSNVMQLIKSKCTSVEELSLCFQEIRNEDFIDSFTSMPNIKLLMIEWYCTAFLPPALISSLEMIAGKLKRFELSGYYKNEMVLPDSLASVFHGLTVLEHLHVGSFDMKQPIIQSISTLKNLVTLDINFLQPHDHRLLNPHDIDMEVIGTLKNLENVYLNYDYGVTDNFLVILSNNAKKLKNLTLVASHITDRGIIALNNLQELTKIDLGLYKPGFGNWGNSKITDGSMGVLTNPRLVDLNLNQCKNITNNSVMKLLKNLPSLKTLTVQNTLVNYELTNKILHDWKQSRRIMLHVSFVDIYNNFDAIHELLWIQIISDQRVSPPPIERPSDESDTEDDDNDNDEQQDGEE